MAKTINKVMRAIRRVSNTINIGKSQKLDVVIAAFNCEKQYWLSELQRPENLPYTNQFRAFRDKQLASQYKSQYELQARQWKMALTEACEAMHKYWQNIFDKVRQTVNKHTGLSVP